MKLDFLANNKQLELEEGIGAVSLCNIKTKTQTNLKRTFISPYSPEQEEKIKDILKAIQGIPYGHPEKAFHIIDPNNVEAIAAYLDVLVPLFKDANHYKNEIKKNILGFIQHVKVGTKDGAKPLDKIAFLYTGNTNVDAFRDTNFGETLEKEYNVAIYQDSTDEGNHGGYYEMLSMPGCTEFGGMRVSEDLIKQRPNVILIIITAPLRPKWRTMAHYMYNPQAPKLVEGALDDLWRLTDEQVVDKYYVEDQS